MSTEQITIRLPIAMVSALREDAVAARRSLAAEVAWNLDQSPLSRSIATKLKLAEKPKDIGSAA